MRALLSLDRREVSFLDGPQWHAFRTDPFRFLLRADGNTADAVWLAAWKRGGVAL